MTDAFAIKGLYGIVGGYHPLDAVAPAAEGAEMTAKETSLEFVEAITFPEDSCLTITLEAADYRRLMKLAKTAALIDTHRLDVLHNVRTCIVTGDRESYFSQSKDMHTAVRAVADRIKEGNHG